MFAVNLCAWGNSPSVSVVIDIPSPIILRIIDIVQNIAAGYFKGHSVAKSKQNNIHKTKLKCLSLPTYERDPAKRTFRVARRRQIACKDGLSTERSWNHSDQVCQEEHIRRIFPCTHCIQEQEYIEPMIYRGKMQSDLIICCLHSHNCFLAPVSVSPQCHGVRLAVSGSFRYSGKYSELLGQFCRDALWLSFDVGCHRQTMSKVPYGN